MLEGKLFCRPGQKARSLSSGLSSVLKADYIIDGLLEKGEQALLFGQPKVGKTFFAIQIAVAAATARPFLSWGISQPRKVLYVNFEMGERVFAERVAANLEKPKNHDFESLRSLIRPK